MVTLKGKNGDAMEIYFEDGVCKSFMYHDGNNPDPEYLPCPQFTKEQLIKFHSELGEFIKTLNCA